MRFHLLSPQNYQRLIACYESSVIGNLPKIFRGDSTDREGNQAKQVIRDLERFTQLLRDYIPEYSIFPLTGRIGNQAFSCQEIGEGDYGRVFRFIIADEQFALKVYKEPGRVGWHGSMGEVFLSAFFSSLQLNDVATFYIGDPVLGWMLSEWVDEETVTQKERTLAKDSLSVETVAHDYGLTLRDHFYLGDVDPALEATLSKQAWEGLSKNKKNWGAGEILIDFGGIRFETPETPEAFSKRLQNKHYRSEADSFFFEELKDEDELEEGSAFNGGALIQNFLLPRSIESPEPSSVLPFEKRWAFFQRYVEHEDIWGIIEDHLVRAEDLGVFDEDLLNVFKESIKDEKSQIAATWLIRFLEESEKAEAIKVVLMAKDMNPLAKAFAASQLDFISDSKIQWTLFEHVLNHESLACQKMAVLMLPRLHESLHIQGFDLAMALESEEIYLTLTWFLVLLPPEKQEDVFLYFLEHVPASYELLMKQLPLFGEEKTLVFTESIFRIPRARRALSSVLGELPISDASILSLFNTLMGQFVDCRKIGAEIVAELPDSIQLEAFQLLLSYSKCNSVLLPLFQNLHLLPDEDIELILPQLLKDYPDYRAVCQTELDNVMTTLPMLESYLEYPETQVRAVKELAFISMPFLKRRRYYQRIEVQYPHLKDELLLSFVEGIETPFWRYCFAHSKLCKLMNRESSAIKINGASNLGLAMTFAFRFYKHSYNTLASLKERVLNRFRPQENGRAD